MATDKARLFRTFEPPTTGSAGQPAELDPNERSHPTSNKLKQLLTQSDAPALPLLDSRMARARDLTSSGNSLLLSKSG